jgi:AcrR family transcriptional regulator
LSSNTLTEAESHLFKSYYVKHLRKQPRDKHAQEIVTSIIGAARESLDKERRERVLSRIAKRAGVGIGSLYDYFQNRSDVFALVLAKITEENVEAFARAMGDKQNLPIESFTTDLVAKVCDTYLSSPRMGRAMLKVAHSANLMPMLAEGQNLVANRLASSIAQRSELKHANATVVAFVVSHATMGLIVAQLWEQAPWVSRQEAQNGFVELIGAALRDDSPEVHGRVDWSSATPTRAVQSPTRLIAFYHQYLKVLPKQSRSQTTLSAIMTSVLDSLSQGSLKITVAEVAEHAGVGIGSLYDYFHDQNGLVAGAVARITEDSLAGFERLVEGTRTMSLEDTVATFVHFALDTYVRRKDVSRAALRAAQALDLMPMLMEGRICLAQSLANALSLRKDIRRKDLRVASYVCVQAMMGVVYTLIWQEGGEVTDEQAANECVRMILAYLRAGTHDRAK